MNATTRRVQLEWREAGRGEPILFLHAFPLNSAMWGPQLAGLPAGWRGVAPDLRGFGASPEGTEAVYTMELFAGDVVALMDRLELGRAAICGSSMGGYIAFELWRLFPERVRALILCDTRAGPDSPEAARARERLAQRVEKEGNGVVEEAMLPKLVSSTTRYQHKGIVESMRAMMGETPSATMARALRGMAVRRDSEPLLRTITVPALVVVGAEDAITGRGQSEFLARGVPGARLATIDDAGHIPPLERPDEFNRVLTSFLAKLPQAAHA
jgi:pimeloyl-ACP methyl ester carboxylesterase